MAVVQTNWQSALNVSGSVVTLATGGASGSAISSIYLANTNTTTPRYVTVLAKGTGISAANKIVPTIEIPPNDFYLLDLANCPIILKVSETLRLYQDTGTDITATAFGMDF